MTSQSTQIVNYFLASCLHYMKLYFLCLDSLKYVVSSISGLISLLPISLWVCKIPKIDLFIYLSFGRRSRKLWMHKWDWTAPMMIWLVACAWSKLTLENSFVACLACIRFFFSKLLRFFSSAIYFLLLIRHYTNDVKIECPLEPGWLVGFCLMMFTTVLFCSSMWTA